MKEETKEQGMNLGNIDKMVQGQEVDKETQTQIDAYIMTLMNVIHSDNTNGSVVEMLKSGPPEQSIPYAALQVNSMVEKSLNKQGVKPKTEVKMAGALYLVSDLTELGNAAQAWETPVQDQEQVVTYFQETLRKYVHQGIKDGAIDPVELQAQTEPLLNEQQMKVGTTTAAAMGLPHSPTANMGMDKIIQDKTKPLQEENAKLKSMLQNQQGQQQQQQAQPQGLLGGGQRGL